MDARVLPYRCDLALAVHDLNVLVVASQAGHEAGTPVQATPEIVDPTLLFSLDYALRCEWHR